MIWTNKQRAVSFCHTRIKILLLLRENPAIDNEMIVTKRQAEKEAEQHVVHNKQAKIN